MLIRSLLYAFWMFHDEGVTLNQPQHKRANNRGLRRIWVTCEERDTLSVSGSLEAGLNCSSTRREGAI